MTGSYLMEVERAIAHLRLKGQPQDERLEKLRQQYEAVLCLLESEFLGALVSGNWAEFDDFVSSFRENLEPPQLQRVSLQEFLEMHK